MRNALPEELSFISEYRRSYSSFTVARWLLSRFEEPVWNCRFGKSNITINFALTLSDETRLTDASNLSLLNCIKRFLCAQTHPSVIGGKTFTPETEKVLVTRAIHSVDYFLLHGCFTSKKSGFRALSKNDIYGFLETISSHRLIKASIYEPVDRVLAFLRTVEMRSAELDVLQKRQPRLFDTVDCDLPEGIDDGRVQLARAWLFKNGFNTTSKPNEPFKYCFSFARLLDYLIGKRVLDSLQFRSISFEYLNFSPRELFIREYRAVPVQFSVEDDRAGFEYVMSYLQVLRVMDCANDSGISLVDEDALSVLNEEELLNNGLLKQKGRFTTLPFEVANRSLGKAVEFYLEFGEALVDQYLMLAEKNWQGNEFDFSLPEPLRRLGVKRFENVETDRQNFFVNLREGSSLYQMLQVLIGAILVLVNTLMARRASEIRKLTQESIVRDGNQFFLAFDLSKATVGPLKKRSVRPLPIIAAKALMLLERLNQELRKNGYESTQTLFFNLPLTQKQNFIPYGSSKPTETWLNLCLNRFCDYIETPLDTMGRRYYVRPHQLRRNFAMLFFWRGSFGGIEILQYFLGHQKPSFTYRYVTESLSGKVLRQVKAQVATELIKTHSVKTEPLAELICERYGVSLEKLYILPENDVTAYVEDLLMAGEAEIEPEFAEGPDGEEYKIIYKVRALKSTVEPQ